MPLHTVALLGATGLVGGKLLSLLQADEAVETVRILVRKPVPVQHPKVEMKLVNFDDLESVKLAIDGCDAVFCAVGTTQKKVKGDEAAYRKVDYDIPVNAARFCAETGCQNFLLVSSVGADSNSRNFYLKLKGEVEDNISRRPIRNIAFFRPSILLGQRAESRPAERVGQALGSFFAFLLVGGWEKYKPVDAVLLAKAMLQQAKEQPAGRWVYEFPEIVRLAKAYRPG